MHCASSCGSFKQHPGKKSGHMLHLLCHQGPLGTVCLQQDSDHMCLWPGYLLHHDTAKHGYSGVYWRVEWCSVVFSDQSRFYLSASDGCTHVQCRPGERHLPECIHPWQTGPTSGFMVCGGGASVAIYTWIFRVYFFRNLGKKNWGARIIWNKVGIAPPPNKWSRHVLRSEVLITC